ncbi:hypothetical protein OG709_32720 [Streptomyces sp. NBC_01267]|uniref:hypothetical protein n=1 Tax=unclassified Streptomyces TaxID=2593676 RepID=UPI002DD92543|nr:MULTISPECIES: hypothetical protein [unclassified Streptomyces]WSC18551.1 hypothetical protein OIE60_02170 [Streptomyces sp. NBC_01766]
MDGLTAALGEAAAREAIPVTTLTCHPGAPALPPVLAQIPLTVRLQLLGERFAGLRHQDPDVAIVGAWADSDLWARGLPKATEGAEAGVTAGNSSPSSPSSSESEAVVAR